MPGSPPWYRSHLQDLIAMVRTHGMPHFFLTLTSDEVRSAWTLLPAHLVCCKLVRSCVGAHWCVHLARYRSCAGRSTRISTTLPASCIRICLGVTAQPSVPNSFTNGCKPSCAIICMARSRCWGVCNTMLCAMNCRYAPQLQHDAFPYACSAAAFVLIRC